MEKTKEQEKEFELELELKELYERLFSIAKKEVIPTYAGRANCIGLQPMKYLDGIDGRIEIVLFSYLDRNRKTFLEFASGINLAEKTLELCRDRQKVLNAELEKIAVQVKNLQADERRIFEKVLSEGLSDDLKEKGNRIKELIRKYDWLHRLLFDYGVVLMNDEKILESDFQGECKKIFGKRLRQARKEAGLNQKQIAEKLGILQSSYAQYEITKRTPSLEVLAQISMILNRSTDWLLGLTP